MAITDRPAATPIKAESLAVAKRLIRIEADSVSALADRINGDFERAVALLNATRGRVVVTGIGKSGHIGRKISATFASTGTPSSFMHPSEAAHGDLGMVTRNDAVMVISKSGSTEDLLNLIPYFKLLNVPVIGLLGETRSPLAEKCDVVLDLSVQEEGCPLDLAPTASTTATLAMGDALAVALMTEKDFKPQDFAFLHPGGALGRRLSQRIEDVMHTGEMIPLSPTSASVRECIVEMTRKRLGATCIVDGDGKLAGIFTDGDLRRAFEKGINLETDHALDVATLKPKTVLPEALVARAVNLMEAYNILVLPVVSGDQRVVGIVHLHDLLKSGIGR
jgi:arabinose-5-phosphate isomerase